MKAKFEYSKDYQEYLILATTFLIMFILVYSISLIGSIYLAYLGIKTGWLLFNSVISLWVWIFAGGLILFSLLFLFMLSSYFFQWDKADTRGYVEVKEHDQPALFQFIRSTAKEAEAPMPHKVFLYNEVNAMVWIDVNFLSFILPVKKNLVLGMGLLQGLNQGTFKAILGHEFAHFSQKANRLNPFIHITSTITSRMVYGQSGYSSVSAFMSSNIIFYIFGIVLFLILGAIQFVLTQLQKYIHQFTLRLSRDNEFHADFIGSTVAGSHEMKLALLQLNESDILFQKTLQLIRQAAQKKTGTENLYQVNRHFKEHSPTHGQYQLPRIAFDDPESTHPQVYERLQRIESYGIPALEFNALPACDLIVNKETLERKLTSIFYETNHYKLNTTPASGDLDILQGNYPPPFDEYFRDRYLNLSMTDLESELVPLENKPSIDENMIILLKETQLLKQEKNLLSELLLGKAKINYFSYKEVPYPRSQLESLIQQINNEINENQLTIKNLDLSLVRYALPKWSIEQARKLVEMTTYTGLLGEYKIALKNVLLQFQIKNGSTNVDLAVSEKKFQTIIKTIQSKLPEVWGQLPTNSSIHRSADTHFSYFLGKNNLQAGLDRHLLEWEEIYLLLDNEARSLMHELVAAYG